MFDHVQNELNELLAIVQETAYNRSIRTVRRTAHV